MCVVYGSMSNLLASFGKGESFLSILIGCVFGVCEVVLLQFLFIGFKFRN
jgi:hypothetical protein